MFEPLSSRAPAGREALGFKQPKQAVGLQTSNVGMGHRPTKTQTWSGRKTSMAYGQALPTEAVWDEAFRIPVL